MITGSVKWFNYEKGYGFIMPDDGSTDVFVHMKEVERSGIGLLREGQKITYEMIVDHKTGKSKAGHLKVM